MKVEKWYISSIAKNNSQTNIKHINVFKIMYELIPVSSLRYRHICNYSAAVIIDFKSRIITIHQLSENRFA